MTRDSERLSDLVSRRRFLLSSGAVGATALAGCTSSGDGDGDGDTGGSGGDSGGSGNDTTEGSGDDALSGEVVNTGSSTVYPVTNAMAERFMEEHPQVNVTVDSTGSGGGFENHFCPGNSDINGASRPVKDSEVENCRGNDVEPIEFHIAGDALTMAVNNDADWVDSMTFEELSQIWRKDGAQMWSDVRDEWPDEEFELFGPASTSGTYDWFNANVIGEEYEHTAQHEPTEEDNLIVQGIQDSQYAMGYFGYAYYNENSDSVKAVKIAAEEGDEPSEPSLANAKDGSYPMARPLFIYGSESAIQREEVYEFLEFYLENAETDLVQEIGYVPSSVEMRDENLSTLEDVYEN
ncbi:phosphate ABC transporter substrate-binding protein PstS family protein [Halobacterium wangiae]|uniref:phosphate ABC transporter substrate-binding protein PstS family protein n=1 Tax=Halobacterium wangiae TaxID=2902623 RepID=UPI001E646227|nr:phosphate ABC transporter substrate-binding protein PstS family protein [Halobacterium wangiae]